MSDKTFFIETWGCQMNDLDTQRLSGQLRSDGYTRVDHEDQAALVLLNTCSIREKSEHKVYSRLGELKGIKARGAKIGVTGCVAQREGEAIIARAPYVDFVIGPGSTGYIDEIVSGHRPRVATDFPEDRRYDWVSLDRPSPIRAQVTVIEGCNKNCTFCIVPTTRGREVSRTLESVIAEVRHAVSTGRVEIELLGQTINAYRCPAGGYDFADLLDAVAMVAGVARLRFVTSHPAEVSERMVEVMRARRNICRFLHLPAQSGSTTILRKMKRLYTRERYLEIIARIREVIPSMMFSTDLIVGFPGETEADFSDTLTLMEQVRFGSLFAFKYSPRPGTPAVRMGAPVDDAVASERLTRLFALQETIQREVLDGYVGRSVQVLCEGKSRNDSSVWSGKTEDNWTVNFSSDENVQVGTLVRVQVDRAQHYTLKGAAA